MFNNRLSLSGFHWFLNLTVTSIWSLLTQSVLLYMQVFMKEADRGDQCVIDTLFSLNVWVFICNVVFVVSMADPLLWSLRQKDSISCTFLGSTKTIMSMRCAKNTILNTCVLVRISGEYFLLVSSLHISRGGLTEQEQFRIRNMSMSMQFSWRKAWYDTVYE